MPVLFSRTTHSLQADSPRFSLVLWGGGAILFCAWSAWFFLARVTVYEVSREARLEVSLSPHPLAAPVSGKIAASHIAIGQEVRQGQLLVELDSTGERLRLGEEEARLRALPAQIAAIRNEIAAEESARGEDHRAAISGVEAARARQREATTAAAFSKDHARRLVELRKTGRIAEIDALRVIAEANRMDLTAGAQAAEVHRLEMEAQTRVHQKTAEIEERKRQAALLEGQLEIARASIARLQQEIDKRSLRAPIEGRVGDVRSLAAGAYVSEGEKLATLVPGGALKIVADFPPAAVLGRVRAGQSARMRLDGFPWAQYGSIAAEVRRVASEIHGNRVRVEFSPLRPGLAGLDLQHGLPGSVEVEIEQTSPALLVLRSAGQIFKSRAQESLAGAGDPSL
jgi:membrane fusion protein, adhesin transport system